MSPCPAARRARATSGRRQADPRSGRPHAQASGQPCRTCTCARPRAGPPAAPSGASRSPRPRSPRPWGARARSARPSPAAS
eukprot:306617-Alexandrium_andersonii.AAC.1